MHLEERGMMLPWGPVVAIDMIGSVLILIIAAICAYIAKGWQRSDPDDIFRDYAYILTLVFLFFAFTRSFGHLVKHVLESFKMNGFWFAIVPFTGAFNTIAFIVLFAFGIYFKRYQKIHTELQDYKNNLEELYNCRTVELEEMNYWIKKENKQRRQAEESLRQTMSTLRNIFNSTAPICITDLNHVLIDANESYKALWAGPEKGGPPIKCYESRPSSICRTPDCPLEKILLGKEQEICETKRLSDFGENRFFLQTTKPFKDADGKLAGTVTSFQEITERKIAQEQLAAERERLAVTLRSIGDGVITTDMQGRVVMLNKVAEKLCGWKQAEAKGKKLDEIFCIIDASTGAPKANPVAQVLETGRIITLDSDTILIDRDGVRKNIADSGAPISDANSKTIGVVLVFRDVTNQIRLENELRKTQKLESVGILAGGIAHDFNNILSAVLGNIDLSIHLLDEGHPVKALLQVAEDASLRAKGLTHQLLTFAEGGSPVRKKVSIEKLVKDSADFVLHGSNVKCDINFPEELWLVEIDPGQMSQVIQNIIINSREAMEKGGTVSIEARNFQGTVENLSPDQYRWVEIKITDEGTGIKPEVIDKIFDPYFSTKEKGSGLGLAICHSIISQHKGGIEVSSTPGSGTEITIILPALEKGSVPDSPREMRQLPSLKGVRVLVMDDEEMVRNIVKDMLAIIGSESVMVADGAEAVKQYKEAMEEGNTFNLVIMDLTIPGGMGGKEAVQEIIKMDPEARVIVASGYSNDPIMSSFEEYGFCAAVIKPFQLHELAEAIESSLEIEKTS